MLETAVSNVGSDLKDVLSAHRHPTHLSPPAGSATAWTPLLRKLPNVVQGTVRISSAEIPRKSKMDPFVQAREVAAQSTGKGDIFVYHL